MIFSFILIFQLKRHRTGESGEYVSTEGQLDSASISGKLPSHYYQEVPICESCFLVYKVINDARQKALKKIQIRKDKSLQDQMNTSTSSLFPVSTNVMNSYSRSSSPSAFNPSSFAPRSLSPGSFTPNNNFAPSNSKNTKRNRKTTTLNTTFDHSQLGMDNFSSTNDIDTAGKALEYLTKLGMIFIYAYIYVCMLIYMNVCI